MYSSILFSYKYIYQLDNIELNFNTLNDIFLGNYCGGILNSNDEVKRILRETRPLEGVTTANNLIIKYCI